MEISRGIEANERVQLASPILGILKGRQKKKKEREKSTEHNTKYSVFPFLLSVFFFRYFLSPSQSASQIRNLYFFWDFICNFPHGMTSMYHRYVLCRESWRSLFKGMKLLLVSVCWEKY